MLVIDIDKRDTVWLVICSHYFPESSLSETVRLKTSFPAVSESWSTEKKPDLSNWNLSKTLAPEMYLSAIAPSNVVSEFSLMSERNPSGTSFTSSGFLCLKSRSYNRTSMLMGFETQWMKAFGFLSTLSTGQHSTSISVACRKC